MDQVSRALLATGGATEQTYIEDVFSTYLYTGTGATQIITNGIDLSGKGGLVWVKDRSAGLNHALFDTARGPGGGHFKALFANDTSGQAANTTYMTSLDASGFTLGTQATTNGNGTTYASWTFREQPKFFDVVTYTGNGANRTISHNLGAVPGCIIVKRTDTTGAWAVYHRSLANTEYMVLNTTAAKATGATYWNSTTPTSTVFSLGTATDVNANGGTYVAYLFAHDAGGFGLTGTDNVISCGSYTGNGSANGPTITLGYEPQWVMIKAVGPNVTSGSWMLQDNMRGMTADGADQYLLANSSGTEGSITGIAPTATGFVVKTGSASTIDSGANYNYSGDTYIYIAIRRGPMKTPTTGTSVFSPVLRAGTGSSAFVSVGFPVDMMALHLTNSTNNQYVGDRLRGNGGLSLEFSDTDVEVDRSSGGVTSMASMTGYTVGTFSDVNSSGNTYINWCFRRAPGFFDVVCYTGDGTNPRNINHNLGVPPELMLVKRRGAFTQNWLVYHSAIGAAAGLNLNLNNATQNPAYFWNATPTATQFSTQLVPNAASETHVAYLFATLPGISKVGSYTGNGGSQTINCGFSTGARFVLIKRTDTTGDWFVWDTARGIVSANDPRLSLNSTAAEVTTDDSLDPDNSGFIVNQVAATNINVNAATYIYLAIA